jgi:hypothetical protein
MSNQPSEQVTPLGRTETRLRAPSEDGRQEPLTFSERSFIGRIGGYLLRRGIRFHAARFPGSPINSVFSSLANCALV